MQAQVEAERGRIEQFVHIDAEGRDQKQIADINDLLGKDCDALIISPNTTATLTPAVENACQKGLPVIVFDRGVDTGCPVTFINPIGGYGFAWVGHFFVEHNRPATFKYPLWSFRGDWVMWSKMIAGTMDAEVERCVALRRAATEPKPEPIAVPRPRDLSVS